MCLTDFTAKKKTLFLKELSETGNVSAACAAAKISRPTAYTHKREDAIFAQAWEDALESAADILEAEARRRAYEGVSEPVFYKGQEVATVQKYSDTLLIFLLKGAKPEKYRENVKAEVTGSLEVHAIFDALASMTNTDEPESNPSGPDAL